VAGVILKPLAVVPRASHRGNRQAIGNNAHGTAAAEIEAESAGTYQLRRLDIVYDVGDSLSLLIGLRQIEGGFVPEFRRAGQAISLADGDPRDVTGRLKSGRSTVRSCP
jgi:xanthine dehydrogenase molybdopterin-binding subunit B